MFYIIIPSCLQYSPRLYSVCLDAVINHVDSPHWPPGILLSSSISQAVRYKYLRYFSRGQEHNISRRNIFDDVPRRREQWPSAISAAQWLIPAGLNFERNFISWKYGLSERSWHSFAKVEYWRYGGSDNDIQHRRCACAVSVQAESGRSRRFKAHKASNPVSSSRVSRTHWPCWGILLSSSVSWAVHFFKVELCLLALATTFLQRFPLSVNRTLKFEIFDLNSLQQWKSFKNMVL